MIFTKILKNTIQVVFVVFNDIIADILNNKKFNPIVTELFIRGEKLKKLSCFCHIFCCSEKYQTRLNSRHYFVMKIPNKRDL